MAKNYLIDYNNTRFINASGDVIEPSITIYRGSEYTFNTTIIENYNTYTPINLSGNNNFGCYIGRLYGISACPVVSSTSFSTDLSALSSGNLNFTFNTTSSALAVDMGTSQNINYQIDIWARDGLKNVLICQSPITINNISIEV